MTALLAHKDDDPYLAVSQKLLQQGLLDAASLDRARRAQAQHGDHLGNILIKLGFVSDSHWADALAETCGLTTLEFEDQPPAVADVPAVSTAFMRDAGVFPLSVTDQLLTVALSDPLDEYTAKSLAMAADRQIGVVVATDRQINAAWERWSRELSEDRNELDDELVHVSVDEADVERLKELASEGSVIRLTSSVIDRAVEASASDIHIEPGSDELVIRNRIDGVLHEANRLPSNIAPALASRIKIMAHLDIAERRKAQDGRIRLSVQGKRMDLRVSTLPSLHGETIVMRLLEQSGEPPSFDKLGMDSDIHRALVELLSFRDGIVMVTGPTGSGKTTTLYGALHHLNRDGVSIISVEDPVEYQVDGVTQVQVQDAIGFGFAHVLRAMVRQDPDIMMVGETRDHETAQIAVQSALTGHLVLTSLHTNNAPAAVTRLIDMGVENYLLTSTIRGIVGQRLVRALCIDCREPKQPSAEQAAFLNKQLGALDKDVMIYRAPGCETCSGTGYRGRIGLYELFVMTDELRRHILAGVDAVKLDSLARTAGMTTLLANGLMKAIRGQTTLEEVRRVVGDR